MTDWIKFLQEYSNFVIAIVNSKGGVGKTTFAYNLLWFLVKNGMSAAIIDLDNGQNSSAEFAQDRADAKIEPFLPVIAMKAEELQKRLPEISKQYKIIIIEFGKAEKEEGVRKALELAIKVSDVIITPLQPTPADVKTVPASEKILADLKTKVPAYLVPNRVKKESQLNVVYGVKAFLKCFKVSHNYITDKLCYQDSLGFDGRSVFEMSGKEPKKAQQELQQIFKEIFHDQE